MDGVSYTVILQVLAFPAVRSLYKLPSSSAFFQFCPFPHNAKHDHLYQGLCSKHRNISRGLGKSANCPRKNGFIATSLDYTSASNFFVKLFKHSPCNTSVYLGNFLPQLETINCAAFQNEVLLSGQNNEKSEGSGRYLFP